MKSIYAGLFLIVACCFSVFATTLDSSDWFGFGGSLGTGGVWSSGSLVENPEALKNIKGFYRVILETDACVELRFQKNIVLAGGLYSLFDFKFKNGEHAHSIDYGFYDRVTINASKTNFICGPWHTSNDLSAPCIHHYFTKTLDEWNFRRGYGRADTDPNSNMFKRTINEFYEHNFNEVENTELS